MKTIFSTTATVMLTARLVLCAADTKPNGCGSATHPIAKPWLVPDAPAGASFAAACNTHDVCYVTSTNKAACDAQFYRDMRSACAPLPRPLKGECQVAAGVYAAAVSASGQASFDKAHQSGATPAGKGQFFVRTNLFAPRATQNSTVSGYQPPLQHLATNRAVATTTAQGTATPKTPNTQGARAWPWTSKTATNVPPWRTTR